MYKDIKKFLNNPKVNKAILYICIALFIVAVFLAAYTIVRFYQRGYNRPDITNQLEDEKKEKCDPCRPRAIDGVFVEAGQENIYPVAVVIDNLIEARPPYGLAKANLVYEVEAEGGITRYLAIFAVADEIDKIGPVRSARPYFVDWSGELSATLVHCGGSPEALVKIKKDNIYDLNEFYQGKYFWRDKNRNAPHNIFISSQSLNDYRDKYDLKEGKYFSWEYKEENGEKIEPTSPEVEIVFKYSDFVVKWIYSAVDNNYTRFLGGKIHQDGDKKEIKSKNIIIQYNETKVIDDELRLRIELIGSGPAVICQDGRCASGRWEKNSTSSRTRYYFANEEEVKFNRGNTWVEILRPEISANY